MTPARIPPLPEDEWTEEQRTVLVNTSPTDEPARGNWYQALVRHPRLHAKWISFGARLLVAGRIPDRDRELVILRTALRTDAEYYWEPHVQFAHEAGLTRDEIDGIVRGPAHSGWSEHDRALLSSVDELVENHEIVGDTWATLALRYDDQQMIELPFLIGHYVMVAYAMRSMGVALEPTQSGFELR